MLAMTTVRYEPIDFPILLQVPTRGPPKSGMSAKWQTLKKEREF